MRCRQWITLALAAVLALGAAGCAEPPEADEVLEKFRKKHPTAAFTAEKDCETLGNLQVWTARRKEDPQVEFHIYSVASDGLFGPVYHMEDDYSRALGEYWWQQYPGDKTGLFPCMEQQDPGCLYFSVGTFYEDRAGIPAACRRLQEFSDYLAGKDPDVGRFLGLAHSEQLTLPHQPLQEKNTFAHCRWLPGDDAPDFAALEEEALFRYTLNAALHRTGLEQFTPEELQAALTAPEGGRPFTAITPAGEAVYWQDLAERHYGGLCFGTLYEVLQRLQWPGLAGSPEAFSFPGADGSVYEFSYAFHDAEYTGNDWGVNTGFYYCKDGEPRLLDAPFYNYMDLYDVEQLTGLRFEEGWLTQADWEALEARRAEEEAAGAPQAAADPAASAQ